MRTAMTNSSTAWLCIVLAFIPGLIAVIYIALGVGISAWQWLLASRWFTIDIIGPRGLPSCSRYFLLRSLSPRLALVFGFRLRTLVGNMNRFNRKTFALAAVIGCSFGFVHLFVIRVIPPTCGVVLDAITGKPVPNVNVLLQVSTYEGWGVHTEVRHRTSTNRLGLFFLRGTFQWDPLFILRGTWVTVNEDRDGMTGGEQSSAATQVLYNPMSNRRGWPVGNKAYFPLTVTFRRGGCDRVWDATCEYKIFRISTSIPLIPVLNNTDGCRQIANSSVQGRCIQLNTYRGAFVHVDTYEDVQRSKELCRQLEAAGLSKICLDQLASYVANPAYDHSIRSQVGEPIPDGMFPESIAGLPVMNNKHCGPRLEFSGRMMCASGYGSQMKQLVAVYVEEWPGSAKSIEATDWRPQYTDHAESRVNAEIWPGGGRILHYQGPMYNSFFWYSGEKHVEVFFYHSIPQRDQFVSYYLEQFPSTLPAS